MTGFDIIFFWVARMVMMGLYFQDGKVPFREVYVHGLIRDAQGQKMSKSKGNVLDPIDLIDGIDLESLVAKRTAGLMQPQMAKKIEKDTRKEFADGIPAFGTDALRFTFAALATTGRDIRFDLGRIEGYRNFCNKLWNASRFVMMQCEDKDTGLTDAPVVLSDADEWIIGRLQQVEAEVAKHFAEYRFDLAAQALYEFTWNEYCDWYLEFTKPALKTDDEAAQRGTRRTLVRVLEALLRLLHPIIPFITETIWQRLAPMVLSDAQSTDSILGRPYPRADECRINAQAIDSVEWLKNVILGVRRIRAEMDIAPSKSLDILVTQASAEEVARFDRFGALLNSVGRIGSVTALGAGETVPEAAMALVGDLQIHIPLAGLIDKDAELARLGREIAKTEAELTKSRSKLDAPGFADRAPAHVVAQERERAEKFEASLGELRAQLVRIERL